MPMIDTITSSMDSYTAEQLAQFVIEGRVSKDELLGLPDATFPEPKRTEFLTKLDEFDDVLWQAMKKSNTAESYKHYLEIFPNGKFSKEAILFWNKQHVMGGRVDSQSEDTVFTDPDASQPAGGSQPKPQAETSSRPGTSSRQESFDGVGMDALKKIIENVQIDKTMPQAKKTEEICRHIALHIEKGRITKRDLIQKIAENHNLFHGHEVKSLIDNGILDYDDFSQMSIDRDFVQKMLTGNFSFDLPSSESKLTQISRTSTEIYFWGIPSSGKTCALGAILSTANNGTTARFMVPDASCQGYAYMTRLSESFRSDNSVGILPEATAENVIYEMGFSLEDQDRDMHPITCIDLAGELFRCMYKVDAGEPLEDIQLEMLGILENILVNNRSGNRKIHFFVIEYGAENREYEGLRQEKYLDAAVSYIERRNIFKENTDGIYLLVTKADKVPASTPAELEMKLKQYIKDKYRSFYNRLERLCRNNEINKGIIITMPFSIGDVCFKKFCRFNPTYADFFVRNILINRTATGDPDGTVDNRAWWKKVISVFKD